LVKTFVRRPADVTLDVATVVNTFAWVVGTVLVALMEVAVLLALCVSNNWWLCEEQDDCNVVRAAATRSTS
jgi:hypothetical protein